MAERKYEEELRQVGENIRAYRKKQDWSQEEMAEMADTSVNTIHRVENGKHTVSLDTVFAISDALNVPVEKLCPERFANIKQTEELKKVEFLFGRLNKENQKVVMETIIPLMNVLILQQSS